MTGNKIAIPLSEKSFKTRLRGMLFALLSCLPSSCRGVYQVSDFRRRRVCSFIINSRVVLGEVRPQANEREPPSLSARCWGRHTKHSPCGAPGWWQPQHPNACREGDTACSPLPGCHHPEFPVRAAAELGTDRTGACAQPLLNHFSGQTASSVSCPLPLVPCPSASSYCVHFGSCLQVLTFFHLSNKVFLIHRCRSRKREGLL